VSPSDTFERTRKLDKLTGQNGLANKGVGRKKASGHTFMHSGGTNNLSMGRSKEVPLLLAGKREAM